MERCPPFPYDLTNCRYMFLNDKVGWAFGLPPIYSLIIRFLYYFIKLLF
jgi:hypothetical protein